MGPHEHRLARLRATPPRVHPPQLMSYLAERNIAVYSTDIDSRDFQMHKPEEVIKSVMGQLEKHGKGIILTHDFHSNTAEALPELIRRQDPPQGHDDCCCCACQAHRQAA